MENPEEILHSLEEFSKMKPKDIPRELEEYLCFVAKTGNPVYQWQTIKSLFREKLLNVITDFYESCPSVEIPPCPNVEMFNYDIMKNFILEKLDTFAAAPFTVQRICELLTTPRKEYNRIDKYMRALEKNILVVSTTEPGRRSTENGEGIVNGIEAEHLPESSNSSHDINVEEMDESPSWPRTAQMAPILFETSNTENQTTEVTQILTEQTFQNNADVKVEEIPTILNVKPIEDSTQETVISCSSIDETQQPYISIEAVPRNVCTVPQDTIAEIRADTTLNITALEGDIQHKKNSLDIVETLENTNGELQNKTISSEDEKQELPERKEHVPLVETILPTCSEQDEDANNTKTINQLEEIEVIKEQSRIENTPIKDQSVSLETVNEKYVESHMEKVKDKSKEQSDEIQDEVSLKDDKWPQIKEKSEQPCVLSTSEVIMKESVLNTSHCSQHISVLLDSCHQEAESLKDPEEKLDSCTEKNYSKAEENNFKETEPTPLDCKLQTLMDVDVPNKIKEDVKEEHLHEEPSSTS